MSAVPLGHGPCDGELGLTGEQQLDVVLEMADGGQRGRLVGRPRYVLVPRSGLDLHPYDGETCRAQLGRPEPGRGPPPGQRTTALLGQHGLVRHGAAVQDDAGEFQAVAFCPALQTGTLVPLAAARTGEWIEPHRQMRLELSLELRFHTPPAVLLPSTSVSERSKRH
ncbi:hypothetical protein [Streptomyces atratus]|uniref:hypothetical protein n=1 Tax=Streptomyces atratus TaxID=1893 RepID=UPI00365C3ACA